MCLVQEFEPVPEPSEANGTCICYARMCVTCSSAAAYVMLMTGRTNLFVQEFEPVPEPSKANGTCICYARRCVTCSAAAAYVMLMTGRTSLFVYLLKSLSHCLSPTRLVARAFVMHPCVLHVQRQQHM